MLRLENVTKSHTHLELGVKERVRKLVTAYMKSKKLAAVHQPLQIPIIVFSGEESSTFIHTKLIRDKGLFVM